MVVSRANKTHWTMSPIAEQAQRAVHMGVPAGQEVLDTDFKPDNRAYYITRKNTPHTTRVESSCYTLVTV